MPGIVKSREDGTVRNRAVYVALGVTLTGHKELLGLWIAPTEGAKFWLSVLTELKNRGMQDCFIACVDGLTGFPEAIEFAATWDARYACHQFQLAGRLGPADPAL